MTTYLVLDQCWSSKRSLWEYIKENFHSTQISFIQSRLRTFKCLGMNQSGPNHRHRISWRYVLIDLLQITALQDCGGWLHQSDIRRAGCQKGQTCKLKYGLKLLSTGTISTASGKPQLCSHSLSTGWIRPPQTI